MKEVGDSPSLGALAAQLKGTGKRNLRSLEQREHGAQSSRPRKENSGKSFEGGGRRTRKLKRHGSESGST